MNNLPHALAYGAAALPVFPLIVGGKTPAVASGFYAATTNPETIKRYWRIADRNIGVPTGIASGFWVVDVDPGGEDGIRRLEAEHGPFPATRTMFTPRGGFHSGSNTSVRCRRVSAESRRTSMSAPIPATSPSRRRSPRTAPIPGSAIPRPSWPSHRNG